MSRWRILLAGLLASACLVPLSGLGTVFYSKDEALELAFGAGAAVEPVPVFLSDDQVTQIERLAKVKVDSQLFNFHVGKRGDKILGYAAIESHLVRTQPETLLIVLSPQGELVRLEMLAFHEPPEYQPPARWMERLYRRAIPDLFLNQGVDGITGATLSSRASLDGARKVMAIYRLAVQEGKG